MSALSLKPSTSAQNRTSTSERSQFMNRRDALNKLNILLKEKELSATTKQANDAWKEHTRIIRGNPVRVYEGMKFQLKNTR